MSAEDEQEKLARRNAAINERYAQEWADHIAALREQDRKARADAAKERAKGKGRASHRRSQGRRR